MVAEAQSAMATEPITLEVDEAVARIFKAASPEERRRLEALVSLQLLKVATTRQSLRELMDNVGKRAQEQGLTEEQLQELIREAEEATSPGEVS